jgi:hypothetical protein
MYIWYQDSTICYAYLTDVPNGVDVETQKKRFGESRWFTRGWTLQELIAPYTLEFYGDQWHSQGQAASLGTKRSLRQEIFGTTRIPIDALDPSFRKAYSIAQKLSWAARRETTRIEDRAYCLMGLFNVNMPLLYGERERAFLRLQEEIMKISTNKTLFAWKGKELTSSFDGLLAISPAYFAGSGGITQSIQIQRTTPFAATNMGLRLEVLLPEASEIREGGSPNNPYWPHWLFTKVYVAVLNCFDEDSKSLIGVRLGRLGKGYLEGDHEDCLERGIFVRTDPGELVLIDPNTYEAQERDRTTIFARLAESRNPLALANHVNERLYPRGKQYQNFWLKTLPNDFHLAEFWPKNSCNRIIDDLCIPTLQEESLESTSFSLTSLFFNNGKDAFVVNFGYVGFKASISMQRWSPRKSPQEVYNSFYKEIAYSLGDPSDRVTYRLSSGRVVSAYFRPQKSNGRFGYGLYISVDKEDQVL